VCDSARFKKEKHNTLITNILEINEKKNQFVFYILQIILFCFNFDFHCVCLFLGSVWGFSIFCPFLVQNHNLCVDIFLYQRI